MSVLAHERPRMRFLGILIALIWSGLAVAMTVSDSLLLSQLGASWVPIALMLASGTTLGGALAVNRLLARLPLASLLLSVLCLGLAAVGAAAVLHLSQVRWLGLALSGWYSASFTLLSTLVFGLAAECMDPHSSKRLFPKLAMAATLGELLGGLGMALAAGRPLVGLGLWATAWSLAALWLLHHRVQLQQWRGARQPTVALSWGALARYTRQQPMARALVGLLASMVLCQGLSQLVISQVLARELNSPERLGSFLGWLVAASNLAELAIAGWLTPYLLKVLGVRLTSTLQPLCMALCLLLLEFERSLSTAVLLWLSRRMLADSLGSPVRNLLYNALPGRLRAPLRAFLDGCVVALSQLCIGLSLRALQPHLSLASLCHLGVLLGWIYWVASLLAARAYFRGLVGDLQHLGLQLHPTPVPLPPQQAQHDPRLRRQAVQQQVLASTPEQALPYLQSEATATVEAALEVLGRSRQHWTREWLDHQLQMRTRRAGWAWMARQGWQDSDSLEQRFLNLALEKSWLQEQHLALSVLGWLEGPELVELLQRSLKGAATRRGTALEVLSQLGGQSSIRTLVALLEPADDATRLRQLEVHLGKLPPDPLAWASHHSDPWVRWAALRRLRGSRPAQQRRMQELLLLSDCQPLRALSLEALEWLRLRCLPRVVAAGSVLQLQGQPARCAHLLLEGQLEPPLPLAGWLECLDGGSWSSDLRCLTACRLLTLTPQDLQALVQAYPECAQSFFSWLCAELRLREARAA